MNEEPIVLQPVLDDTMKKGLKLAHYFIARYGYIHAKKICNTIAWELERQPYEYLVALGRKIAFFIP